MHPADIQAAQSAIALQCNHLSSIEAPAMRLIAQIFPYQHGIPKGYFDLPDPEAERIDADIERHSKARELKIKAFHDFIYGADTNALRLPRPDAGRYTTAARKLLMWAGIFGCDETFRRAAAYSLIANLRLDAGGYFDRQEDSTQ